MKENVMPTDISIRVFTLRVDAEAAAKLMRENGFTVPPISNATVAANWNNSTATPPVSDDVQVPCWVVIGKR